MIKFCILGSGSKGNSVYTEIDGYGFLLDAGLNFKTMKKRLSLINRTPEDVNEVLVTHQHNDHVESLPQFQKLFNKRFTPVLRPPGMVVKQFDLSHDDPCIGYTVEDSVGNKLGYITDTGIIPEEAIEHIHNCNAIILEFNFDVDRLTEGPYPAELQERIFSDVGHMMNSDSKELLKRVTHPRLEVVVCYHLSETNNNHELALYEAECGLLSGTEDVSLECKLVCAEQNNISEFFTLI